METIGFEKVMKLGLQCRKVALISKKRQKIDADITEYKGYFIITHSSNEQKIKYLKEMSDKLNLNLIIERW